MVGAEKRRAWWLGPPWEETLWLSTVWLVEEEGMRTQPCAWALKAQENITHQISILSGKNGKGSSPVVEGGARSCLPPGTCSHPPKAAPLAFPILGPPHASTRASPAAQARNVGMINFPVPQPSHSHWFYFLGKFLIHPCGLSPVLAQAEVVSGFLQQPPGPCPVFHLALTKCILHIIQPE